MENHDSTRVLVIMPAWNEAESVGDTVREVLGVGCPYDVLVVNDGSSDATAEVAAEAGATVLNLPFNLGVGGAMRAGFKYAKRLGYSRVIQVDADGSMIPGTSARCSPDWSTPTSQSAPDSRTKVNTR
ncbi:uncharacterized protein MJ1222 [Arthrobacter sp. Hiyo8]|nr:uncharacterized protein MJ1222 [Arthrobacter sp. Hiyo8]